VLLFDVSGIVSCEKKDYCFLKPSGGSRRNIENILFVETIKRFHKEYREHTVC
jgi:hypothetical protein